jgi:DNA polymerase-3 subunit alpha
MKDVEAVGLVKFDFLGLTTLTILDWTLRYIKRLDPSSTITLESLPLDDPEAYRIFATAKTTAIFQFESRGMRDLLKSARPDRFEDIIALVSLYRPGPMDLIPDFIARKHGKPFDYPDPRVKSVLEETYGIMVYQEQVMLMAQLVGGYSLGAADLLRRAMGKKKPEEMAQQRSIFREGAARSGLSEAKADELFDLMEKFAGYGFNKSHAAAYALVAYHTAYFKAHHAAAFMAANLSQPLTTPTRSSCFMRTPAPTGSRYCRRISIAANTGFCRSTSKRSVMVWVPSRNWRSRYCGDSRRARGGWDRSRICSTFASAWINAS